MKTTLTLVWVLFATGIALADTSVPTPVAPPFTDSTGSAAVAIDASKPTALLVGSPQGAVMLTPEMVDKIVRAQTPEYLRSIAGTPAPTALGTSSNPSIRIPANFSRTIKPSTVPATQSTTALK